MSAAPYSPGGSLLTRATTPLFGSPGTTYALIGSFTYSAAEFADTAEWVGTVPDGIDALIDGRVGWEGASQSFDDLARGRSTASKILVFPHGPPTSGSA